MNRHIKPTVRVKTLTLTVHLPWTGAAAAAIFGGADMVARQRGRDLPAAPARGCGSRRAGEPRQHRHGVPGLSGTREPAPAARGRASAARRSPAPMARASRPLAARAGRGPPGQQPLPVGTTYGDGQIAGVATASPVAAWEWSRHGHGGLGHRRGGPRPRRRGCGGPGQAGPGGAVARGPKRAAHCVHRRSLFRWARPAPSRPWRAWERWQGTSGSCGAALATAGVSTAARARVPTVCGPPASAAQAQWLGRGGPAACGCGPPRRRGQHPQAARRGRVPCVAAQPSVRGGGRFPAAPPRPDARGRRPGTGAVPGGVASVQRTQA
jgi:hypothetical protein